MVACDLIDYHPYDGRVDSDIPQQINEQQIQHIERLCRSKDTIRFAWVGDTQRAYDELQGFVEDINHRGNVDFVIHGGDYTEFGTKLYLINAIGNSTLKPKDYLSLSFGLKLQIL